MTTELFKKWAEFWPEKQLKFEAIPMISSFYNFVSLFYKTVHIWFDKNFLYF